MLLSPSDDVATLGIEPLRDVGRGAWTQAQRYTSSELLVSGPTDTAQLDASGNKNEGSGRGVERQG